MRQKPTPKAVEKEMKHFIDGQFVSSSGQATFEVFDPTIGQPYAVAYAAGTNEIDNAVNAARRALGAD